MPHFSPLSNGLDKNSMHLVGLLPGLNEMMSRKHLAQCLAHECPMLLIIFKMNPETKERVTAIA